MRFTPFLAALSCLIVLGCSDTTPAETTPSDTPSTSDVSVDTDTVAATDVSTTTDTAAPIDSVMDDGTTMLPEEDTFTPAPQPGDMNGETCSQAIDLAGASTALEAGSPWPYRLEGSFGESNDYNPLSTSGLQPGCSMVYDATGLDSVVKVDLTPGETISMELFITPNSVRGGIYVLDACPDATWPDLDESGACGNNEYQAHAFCVASCGTLSFSFTHPPAIDGEPTETKTYWFVIDTIETEMGDTWELSWMKSVL